MGSKNNSEDFVSSRTSNAFSPSRHQYINAQANHQHHLVANVGGPGRSTNVAANFSPYSGKHKLPMQQVSRPPTSGSIGVSVITPSAPVKHNQKDAVYKKQQQLGAPPPRPQKKSSVRSGGDGFSRNTSYSKKTASCSAPSAGLSITPVNHSYTHNTKSGVPTATPVSAVQSHTQQLSKYMSNCRYFHTEKIDMYSSDDSIFEDFVDKRAQYANLLPPDFQYVLQDHSYSQLPESPPPPPIPTSPVHQRTTINGLGRMSSSSGLNKVTLNNNRVVNVGGIGPSSIPNNMNSGSGRLNHEKLHTYPGNTINNYSSISNNVHHSSNSLHNNITNAFSPNLKKSLPHGGSTGAFSHIPRGLLKSSLVLDKPEESDLSEDDRLPDPHGEETETAPEAEGEEESVTRCICDFQHDDGYMISCDKCLAWQHVVCMGIDWENIPDEYQCEKCQPRPIDKRRAIEIQKKKIENKLCVGLNDDSDSSDAPTSSSRSNKNQTKKKCKGKRTVTVKRKNIRESKEAKPKKNVGSAKKRNPNDSAFGSGSPQSPSISSSGLSAEKKKQLLIERKQMLLEKKQINKKRTMRKQAQNTKKNVDKMKMDAEFDIRNSSSCTDKDDTHQSIQQVREWVDRYEEAVTNHYSQELRARLNAAQVNSVNSDLKFTATLRSIEKCRTSLLSTGGKIVLATCSLSPNQPIIELRGKYMYTGAESFRQSKITHFTPYVFYYKLTLPRQDIEICVDCRSYGNFARFIRRSCKPNAELRHCIRKTSLHLYIIATQPLKKNSEILIGHYSPETAKTCVCGSPENCTAADTPYTIVSTGKLNDKSKESQIPRSVSPVSTESTPKNKKSAMMTDKNKKKVKEGKKKLTKENRRGRRRSPSSGSNTDQEEFSSREDSPLPPAKLTVSLWGKPGSTPAPGEASMKSGSDEDAHTNEHLTLTNVSPSPAETETVKSSCEELTDCETLSTPAVPLNTAATNTGASDDSSPVTNDGNEAFTVNNSNSTDDIIGSDNSTPKQNTRSTRQSEYARKEKQQLDMPLFFETPNNHKMTREEKKLQAIMKMIEAMEKSEARKQENQKHRRESSSESEVKKNFTSRRNIKGGRKSADETKNRDEKTNGRIRKDSMNCHDEDEDHEGSKENSMKLMTKSEPRDENGAREKKSGIIENGGRIKVENRDVQDEDEDSDVEDRETVLQSKNVTYKKRQPPSKANNKLVSNEKDETEEDSDNEGDSCKRAEKLKGSRTPVRTSRVPRPTPKARAIAKPKVTIRARKRKSESEAEASPDTDIGDISERTRSAIQRQKKTPIKEEKCSADAKSVIGYSPGKFCKDEVLLSPCGTPPKIRERLDSSSSSGGTPPTPVSDTCLLVASAIGHLTDFKFPNTKKELMNAWFKEERKPSPDEENVGKLPNQEGNNEYAKKRWLRQAISEEGDGVIPRPEEAVSPNGEYGGPLKKRRFARESMLEHACNSLTQGSFGTASQISFEDEADLSSPDASPFQESEGDNVPTCHSISLQSDTKIDEMSLLSKLNETEAILDKITADLQVDEEIAKVASESVADTIASILAPVNAQMASPPRPPSVSPPRTPSPPPEETEKLVLPETRSPPVSKKKLSLTEYQRRKGAVVPSLPPVPVPPAEPVDDVAQEILALADPPSPNADLADAVGRSSSRSSVTSSSASEDEDDSHAASAQVIARSLMIESRHLSYGPQASALFNSIRSGTSSQLFNAKPATTTGPPLARENLADRLKHEFGVHVQEDENEKNKNAPPPLSPIKIPVQITTGPIAEKDFRMKKTQPPPPPPGPPPLPIIPPPLLPPLPDPPRLFQPTFYPYPVTRVAPALSGAAPLFKEQLRSSFFVAPPPPPPPSGAPPTVPLLTSSVPPPPPSK